MKIIDTVGTLELYATGRRCTNLPEDGEIVRVHCTKCDETQLIGKNLAYFVWASLKASGGWHTGCLDSEARARWAASHGEIQGAARLGAAGECPVCNRRDCGGAVT